MARIDGDVLPRRLPARLWLVPVASTIAGSAIGLLPVIASAPMLPSFGLLMALAWRILRPEMWPAWVALPLGMVDDLINGAPLGTAGTLWTIAFLGLDFADGRPMWRDYWLDWGLASLAILFCGLGDWAISGFVGGAARFATWMPLAGVSVILFPAAVWLTARLDRWRLRR